MKLGPASLRIRQQADALRRPGVNPLARLRALRELRLAADELDDAVADEVGRALRAARELDPRPTWVELGEILGVSPQRAEQLSRTTTTKKDPT